MKLNIIRIGIIALAISLPIYGYSGVLNEQLSLPKSDANNNQNYIHHDSYMGVYIFANLEGSIPQSEVKFCILDSNTGNFINCHNPISGPVVSGQFSNLVIAESLGITTDLYGDVWTCPIKLDYTINSCIDLGPAYSKIGLLELIKIHKINNINYAYVVSNIDYYKQYLFSGIINSGSPYYPVSGGWFGMTMSESVQDIAFVKDKAYIAYKSYIAVCSIESGVNNPGNINCSNAQNIPGFKNIKSLTTNNVDTLLVLDNDLLPIQYFCNININGAINGSCKTPILPSVIQGIPNSIISYESNFYYSGFGSTIYKCLWDGQSLNCSDQKLVFNGITAKMAFVKTQ